jgi:hypothetical protein
MKVPDAVIRLKDFSLIEFMDDVQAILNNGLYEMRIFGSIPDWAANDGENGIYVSGSIRQMYFHLAGVWCSLGFSSTGTLQLFDADVDTGITPEATLDEDVIRFYTAGFYNFSMGTNGMSIAAGLPLYFDGVGGDSYWVYDTTTNYLTGYVDGIKRIEL